MAKTYYLKNTAARLIVVLGANCIPGQTTPIEVEDETLLLATIKGVEGLKLVKSMKNQPVKVAQKVEETAPDLTDDEDEDEDEDETEQTNGENKTGDWSVKL